MNVEALFAILDELSPEDRERVEAYLAQQDIGHRENLTDHPLVQVIDQENQPYQGKGRQVDREKITADLDAAIDEFWGDSSEEEMQAIFEAMRTKSTPSKKAL